MILFTSDLNTKRAYKTSMIFGAAAVFFAVFGGIYECFSHQVYSGYMIFAFLIPLTGGALPFGIAGKMNLKLPARAVTQLYGGGIMMLTLGSVMKGVLDIYGTTNRKIGFYPAAGFLMIVAALILTLIRRRERED